MLGAVAVVDIEVEHGDALKALVVDGVLSGEGGGVEEAESHGAVGLGVVARWAGEDERSGAFCCCGGDPGWAGGEYGIDGGGGGADGEAGGVE